MSHECCPHAAALAAQLAAVRAEGEQLRADLVATEDASATLYGAFADAAGARDHATAQVLIQNGETSRAATAAGVEQQRADRAETELSRLRRIRSDGMADPRVEAAADALSALGVPRQQAWDFADASVRAALAAPVDVPREDDERDEGGWGWMGPPEDFAPDPGAGPVTATEGTGE